MGFFISERRSDLLMKTTIEQLEFPSVLKEKLNKHINTTRINVECLNGSHIKLSNTNLCIANPHKVIVSNSNTFLIGYIYDDENYIYLKDINEKMAISKFIACVNSLM